MTIEGEVIDDYWVKGIGNARYGIEANGLEVVERLPGVTVYFISCYDESGECIITADDFDKPAYTSDIRNIRSELCPQNDINI